MKDKVITFFGNGLHMIGAMFFSRLIVDIGVRIFYPFIPQFSEGLLITVTGFSWLLFLRSSSSLLGPIFAAFADKYGYRKIMMLALLMQGFGALGFLFQWGNGIPMFLLGISAFAFCPSQQAYISGQIEYHKRGRALAIVEISWAIVGLLILPLVGWLIESLGWRSPFLLLGILSFISIFVLLKWIPETDEGSSTKNVYSNIVKVIRINGVRASIGVAFFLFMAIGSFTIIWGIWLNADFGYSAFEIGLIAAQIGLGELFGVIISGLGIDRIGKRNGSLIGILVIGILLLILLSFQESLKFIIILLILIGGTSEFTIVSLLPLYSEQAPEARATIFSLTSLGSNIGSGLGGLLTAYLWQSGLLSGVFIFSIISLSISLILLSIFLKEQPRKIVV